jgi:ubiquinone/menaquinone biosynthesis C-methylase UbiE
MKRSEYFDQMADRWDQIHGNGHKAGQTRGLLRKGLRTFGVGPAERVVDLGCGTGVLLGCLLGHLGSRGRVHAVDFAPRMIARAKKKHPDERVDFLVADAGAIPVPDASVDRVVCFSAWPHFPDPDAVIRELRRILKPGGRLHVWHTSSREKINDIHRNVHQAVCRDMLEPAGQLSERISKAGLTVEEQRDDEDAYLVTARKDDPT